MLRSSKVFCQLRLLNKGVVADATVMALLLYGLGDKSFIGFLLRARVVIEKYSPVLVRFGLTLHRIVAFGPLTVIFRRSGSVVMRAQVLKLPILQQKEYDRQ